MQVRGKTLLIWSNALLSLTPTPNLIWCSSSYCGTVHGFSCTIRAKNLGANQLKYDSIGLLETTQIHYMDLQSSLMHSADMYKYRTIFFEAMNFFTASKTSLSAQRNENVLNMYEVDRTTTTCRMCIYKSQRDFIHISYYVPNQLLSWTIFEKTAYWL